MDTKVRKDYLYTIGSNMDIKEEDLDTIAVQIENVINTNFPHIRVHLQDISKGETSDSGSSEEVVNEN